MTIDMLRVFKALSERTRLRIIRLLMEQELCVCEMMFVLGLAQSRLSHQLRILRDAGLVEDTRDGQWIIYRIPARIRAVVAPLLALFPQAEEGRNGRGRSGPEEIGGLSEKGSPQEKMPDDTGEDRALSPRCRQRHREKENEHGHQSLRHGLRPLPRSRETGP